MCLLFVWAFFLSMCVACGKEESSTIQLMFPVGDCSNVTVSDGKTIRGVAFDESNCAEIRFPDAKIGYYTLRVSRARWLLFVKRGEDLTVKTTLADGALRLLFEGKSANENTYLNGTREIARCSLDSIAEFSGCVAKLQELKERQELALEQKGFDRAFVELEKKRLECKRNLLLANWIGVQYKDDARAKREFLRKMVVEDEEALVVPEYIEYLRGVIGLLYDYQWYAEDADSKLEEVVKYVDSEIGSDLIAERLLVSWVFPVVDRKGIVRGEVVDKIVRDRVKDDGFLSEYEELVAKWERLLPGKPMLNFEYEDKEGEKVRLESFRGKYVFLDLWATWCIPCREELPYMQKLERDFAGRGIEFVSISIDREKEDWSRMVEELQLGGVQLYAGSDASLTDFLNSTAIPRFVLIDREGRIVDVNMTRPSNPVTAEALWKLKGI